MMEIQMFAMLRWVFLVMVLLVVPLLAAAPGPNVLFIMVDDLNRRLGCYGDRVVVTPHIDRLAGSSLVFHRATCAYPLCAPTRSSMLTGMRPLATQIYDNSTDWTQVIPKGRTFPEFFRQAGYETVKVGKIFHEGNAGRDFDDTDRWETVLPSYLPELGKKPEYKTTSLYENVSEEERKKNYDMGAWKWGPVEGGDLSQIDGHIAEQAVRFLSAPRTKPFFFAVGFKKPHLPCFAPKKYFDLYEDREIPVPQPPADALKSLPVIYSDRVDEAFKKYPEKRAEAIKAYLACVSYIDACVGRVMEALEMSGLVSNTIVVFTGDHGFNLGQHRIWGKMNLFEDTSLVPLLVRAPGLTRPGSVKQVVEFNDILPTLAELCRVPVPKGLDAVSMAPVLRDPMAPAKGEGFTFLRLSGTVFLSMVTDRFRFARSVDTANRVEMYDLASDPGELRNVAGEESFRELRRSLEAHWEERLKFFEKSEKYAVPAGGGKKGNLVP